MASALLAALAGACDGSEAQRIRGSCLSAAQGLCNDYVGASWSAESVEAACGSGGAVFSADSCPTNGVAGSCTLGAGSAGEYVMRFYAPHSATDARQRCASLGGGFE